jgi:ubiquinone/menaquinone biosynthesis C-methylase UbiE
VDKLVTGLSLAGRRVLDIGCGQGRPACYLAARYGARVVGTDLEGHLVERARERARREGLDDRVSFLQVQPGPLCFADDSFDVVLSTGAFTQVEDKAGMFRECRRVLRPGGALRACRRCSATRRRRTSSTTGVPPAPSAKAVRCARSTRPRTAERRAAAAQCGRATCSGSMPRIFKRRASAGLRVSSQRW